jgi:hypothetical protein
LECTNAHVAKASRRFFEELAHRFGGQASHVSQLDSFACQHAHGPVVVSIRDVATGHGNEMGRLFIAERLPPSLLPFVGEHRLDASGSKSLSDIADGLLRDIEYFGNFGIGPSFIAFEQDPRSRQGSGIGFPSSYKDLHMVSFV